VAYVSHGQAQKARQAANEVASREKMHLALQDLRSSLAEADSARRISLLLTSDEAHGAALDVAIRDVRDRLNFLDAKLQDAQQRAHLANLRPDVEEKLQDLIMPEPSSARAAHSASEEGLTNRIRERIGAMDRRQNEITKDLQRKSEDSQHRVETTVIAGNVISFFLVATALILLERESQSRCRAEAELRSNEERYRNLVLNIPDVPWKTDAAGAPTYIGEGIHKLTGYTPAELIAGGASFWRTRVHEADAETADSGFRGLFEAGIPLDVEYRFQRKDGTWLWMYVRAAVVSVEDGIRCTQGLVSDITGRKSAEASNLRLAQALLESNTQLESRNREVERATLMKSRFLANMSHELRTPLNAIMGFSELLEDPQSGTITERQQRWLGHIRTGSVHLLQLINDVLDLSRIEADQLKFQPEAVRLSEAIPEVMSILRPLAQARQVNLKELVPEELVVEVDRTRLKQIVYNLMSNAVKFTPAHGLVRLEAKSASEFVCISVRDTGVGIRPEDQTVIFEEFRQVSNTNKGVTEGTGLGLAITKRLVERQGGKIWVESEPGKGSRFSFTVRRSRAQPLQPVSTHVQRAPGEVRILLVDGEALTRELLGNYLQAEGFRVVESRTASAGFKEALASRPDVIILDVLLPEGEGWDLLRDLKQEAATRELPVIVASILDQKEKGYQLGAADYLIKPVSREALLQALQKHLSQPPAVQRRSENSRNAQLPAKV
jgi:PAS domain S-box-containing protein